MKLPGKSDLSHKFRKFFLLAWPFFLAAIVFLSHIFAISHSGLVEKYYSKGFYPLIARLFSSISRLFAFSLWDVFWIIVIWLVISGLILILFKKMKLLAFCFRILQFLALGYSIFYILWGYNYYRPGIEKRIGWEIPKADEALFKSILDTLILKSNSSYIPVLTSEYSDIEKLVEDSYQKNCGRLGINYPNGTRRPKVMLLSSLYAMLGVSGYFGPFFNEIHVDYYVLPVDYPFLLGHEKAHQFGITSEAEANLVSYIICVTSDDKRLKYSGYQSMLLYYLRDASHFKDYHDYINKIDARVLQDLRFRQKYYQNLESRHLSDMQTKANDTYLKVNHIEKGVKNYNQVVSLVISWYYNSKNY